ncbi:MAG: hydrolase [Planctomycetota bacterium]|jgi:glutamate carboxypeptidase
MSHTQAAEWFENQAERMAEDLEILCNMNSGSENLHGLEQVAGWLQDYFGPLDVPCRRISFPSFRVLDDRGVEIEQSTGPALRWDWIANATSEKDAGRKPLLMTIHYDTVYGSDHPFQRCQRLEGRRMRGPGVIDAKGGIIILRYAALAAKQFLANSPLRFSVVLTPDEEIGSPASTPLWREIGRDYEFGLLFEPSMADGSLVSTRKGTGTFVFKVEGQAAHAGRNFQAGRNAIVHAAGLAQDLHQLNGQRENVTVNVGRIRGGDAVNVVPDLTVLRANVRVADGNDQNWIEARVQQLVQKHHAPDAGYRVSVHGGIHSPPKLLDSKTEHWMRWVEQEGHHQGQPIRWKPSGGASDGNKLLALGLSNIDTFGPDGDGLHSDQEWIDLESLPKKALLVFQLLARYVAEGPIN